MAEWSAESEVVAKGGRGRVVETADPLVCETAVETVGTTAALSVAKRAVGTVS
jgi:hypothetical protein